MTTLPLLDPFCREGTRYTQCVDGNTARHERRSHHRSLPGCSRPP